VTGADLGRKQRRAGKIFQIPAGAVRV